MGALAESWRPVVGYEGSYEVSDRGRVRSVDRMVGHPSGSRRAAGRLLRPSLNSVGYLRVSLTEPNGSRRRTAAVHVLVLAAFVSPRPSGAVVCHGDGDPTNNRLDNLRWDTPAGNCLDTIRHGRHRQINKTHCPYGHAYDASNTQVARRSNGRTFRMCRACQADTLRRKRAAA